jgi:type VI secretion system secreted protein VgrG
MNEAAPLKPTAPDWNDPKTAPYAFLAFPFPASHFIVRRVAGREAISRPFSFDVTVTARRIAGPDLERAALGQQAALLVRVGGSPRAITGVVDSVRATGPDSRDGSELRFRLVPRLALLRHKRGSRIFQDLSVDQVVERVLGEAGIAASWQLTRKHPVKAYVTQYEESDLDFVHRLLAEEGIYYAFVAPPATLTSVFEAGDVVGDVAALAKAAAAAAPLPIETLHFSDAAGAYPPIVIDGGRLHFNRALGLAHDRRDQVVEFATTRRVRPNVAEYRDYDPMRPQVALASRSSDESGGDEPGGGPFDQLVVQHALETYEHHGHFLFPDHASTSDAAVQIQRRRARDGVSARGKSLVAQLTPGHRFKLEDHPIDDDNGEHVVVRVSHRGEVAGESAEYENDFVSVPAHVAYLPKRPRRRAVQGLLTAVVVGPPGHDIHVDSHGRVKVAFHWDRRARHESSSCWIRTVQPWAGAGFGHQFVPRVGMEVAVLFDGGDSDKPVVIGSLYNGAHVSPFMLPAEKTKSGLRTRSSPGGEGFNELSFDDASGKERVYLHAQRDLDESVGRDRSASIQSDDHVLVGGSRHQRVAKDDVAEVHGDRREEVRGTAAIHHRSRREVVGEALDLRISGARTTLVEGSDRLEVRGAADTRHLGDLTTRVEGNHVVVVGTSGGKRSLSLHVEGAATLSTSDGITLDAAAGITLRCGDTSIRIGPGGIELTGEIVRATGEKGGLELGKNGVKLTSDGVYLHMGDKLLAKTDDASLAMGSEVKIDGTQILLNSPEKAKDEAPPEPEPPTEIELVDHDGHALPNQPFVIVLDDGTEQSGVTDAEGKAKLELPRNGTIHFERLVEVEPA